jgi:hypothetical protein
MESPTALQALQLSPPVMAQPNRTDSPYLEWTAQKDNQRQLIIKHAVDFLMYQVEVGKGQTLTAHLAAMARFHNYSFGNILSLRGREQ